MDEFPEGFELDALLAPIAGEKSVGIDIREDYSPQSLYYRLRDARSEARAAERQSDASGEADAAPPQQWRTIRELAIKVLTEQSKDVEVASWYTESLLRSDGLVGLCAGARLIAGLVENYWDELYPMPDEDGMSTRIAPVMGLNGQDSDGTIIQALRKTTVFTRMDGSPVALWQFEESVALSGIDNAARREQRIAAGAVPFETMETEARAYGATRFGALRTRVEAALEAWKAMGEMLDAKAGYDAPPTGRVTGILIAIKDVADRFALPAAPAGETGGTAVASGGGVAAGGGAAVAGGGGGGPRALNTRDDALRMLQEVADYFRRTEPQSPLSYTLDDAVRRGRMSLLDLLQEVVPDWTVRSSILTSLGIKAPSE